MFDIADSLDEALCLEGLEATGDDGLVKVGAQLDVLGPDPGGARGVDDGVDHAFIGGE